MSIHPNLEAYLQKLDQALSQIATSDRSDIVTEIKSHVLDAQENNPEQSIDSILASLGEPESVANKYLLERGLKPVKPSKSPVVKWLTIGFLGTLAIAAIFVVAIIYKFSPLIEVDEEKGKVSILGGAINIDESEESVYFKIGDKEFSAKKVEGTHDSNNLKKLNLHFVNGKFRINPSQDSSLHWKCEIVGEFKDPKMLKNTSELSFRFKGPGAKCEFEIPEGLNLSIQGVNGKIQLNHPTYHVNVDVTNGEMEVEPALNEEYRYVVDIQNGKVSVPEPSSSPDAHVMNVNMVNGKFRVND